MSCFADVTDETRKWGAWLRPLLSHPELPECAGMQSAIVVHAAGRDGFDLDSMRRAVVRDQADRVKCVGYLLVACTGVGMTSFSDEVPLSRVVGAYCGFPWSAEGCRSFGDAWNCVVFTGTESAGFRAWRGEVDNSFYDEDDPRTQIGMLTITSQSIRVGASRTGCALEIDAGLRLATSSRSEHFGNDPLLSTDPLLPGRAALADVAVLRVSEARPDVLLRCAPGEEPEDPLSCQRDGQDSFMLNFISTSARAQVNRHHFT